MFEVAEMQRQAWDDSENKIDSRERAEARVVFNKTRLRLSWLGLFLFCSPIFWGKSASKSFLRLYPVGLSSA
jgi:hypothetical protein